MGPYQNAPQLPPQPPTNNPYEFIFSPQKPQKKGFGLGNNSFALLLTLIIGGATVLIVILWIVATMLGGNKVNTTDFVGIAQTQNELIRVSNQGKSDAVQQTTKNLAVTIEYGLMTQQQQTVKFIANNGTIVEDKQLVLKQNATTDQQLASAKATSTFDLTFAQLMQNQLTSYATTLKQLYNKATGDLERDMLSSYYEQAQLLISQIPYTQEEIESAGQ